MPSNDELVRLRRQVEELLKVNELLQDALSRLEAENLTLRQTYGGVARMRERGARLWWAIPGGRRWK